MALGKASGASVAVPFVDLGAIHTGLKDVLVEDLADLIDRGDFTGGAAVGAFEAAFADYCGTRLCVGVSSGIAALRVALLAAGIEPGDEVAVPANTFAATFEAVLQTGAVPVVTDASEEDYNLDGTALEAALSDRTRFVLPVHVYGQMADLRRIRAVADRHGLAIVEDACQAHGAARDGLRAGAGGLAGAFSFYPAKNLGAMGDAGALVTDDDGLAERARALREHGQYAKYQHALLGDTARLDTMQALVLLRKLPLLDGWNAQRRDAARFYSHALDGVGDLRLPPVPPGSEPVWHLYVVRTADPDRLATFLEERGVRTGRHYPQPPHLAPAYAFLGHSDGAFPVAERLAREVLSLPLFPGIAEAQLEATVQAIRAYFRNGGAAR